MKRQDKEMLYLLKREKAIRAARKSFWSFCKLLAPDFYKEDRIHLKILADTLEKLYTGQLLRPDGTPYRRLMLNLPP